MENDPIFVQHKHVFIIVPFRSNPMQKREDHLEVFECIFQYEGFHIFVIEQSDDGRRFNRGALLNVGYDLVKRTGADFEQVLVIFHDVDLIPDQKLIRSYALGAKDQVFHLASVWPRYMQGGYGKRYLGGVISMKPLSFEALNGFPNQMWGWGGEDDEMWRRIQSHGGLGICRTKEGDGTLMDLEEGNDKERSSNRWENKFPKDEKVRWAKSHSKRWKEDGLSNLHYDVLAHENRGKFHRWKVQLYEKDRT